MKALILSDIHANIIALEAIWTVEKDADVILCCGDLVDYGPYPRDVIAWVRAHNVLCVQGNHDAWVPLQHRMGNTADTVSEHERTWAHLNAGLLHDDDLQFLESLPRVRTIEMDGMLYGMAHLFNEYNDIDNRYVYERFRSITFTLAQAPLIKRLIFGHTHKQGVHYVSDDWLWMNPGSASYHRKNDPDQTAHYATIIDGQISLKRTPYDLRPLYQFVKNVKLKDSEREVATFFFGPR